MQPADIAARCERAGLARKRLAELSELDETTVERTLNGKTRPLYDTVEKMKAGLIRHEIDLLRHLARLHPQEAVAASCPEVQAA